MKNLCVSIQTVFFETCQTQSEISDMRKFIQWANSLIDNNPVTFIQAGKELSKIFICLLDKASVENLSLNFIGVRQNNDGKLFHSIEGKYKPNLVFRHEFLNHVFEYDEPIDVKIKRVATLCKLHTTLVRESLDDIPVQEFLKIRDRITRKDGANPIGLDEIQPYINYIVDELVKLANLANTSEDRRYLPIKAMPLNKKKSFVFRFEDRKPLSLKRDRSNLLLRNVRNFLRNKDAYEIFRKFPEEFCSSVIFGCPIEQLELLEGSPSDSDICHDETPIGVIQVINEPGYKLRVVCEPHDCTQSLSAPAAYKLAELNRAWVVQAVNRQEEACNFLARILASHGNKSMCHSIDMESFTDYFSYWNYQRRILKRLIENGVLVEFDLAVQDFVCKSKYVFRDQLITYNSGTPMGTFASFPLASLSNGILLAIATMYMRGFSPDGFKLTGNKVIKFDVRKCPGRICGDDVVIYDDDVATKYRELAKCAGLVIQPEKCISSYNIAEFCSKIITKFGYCEMRKLKEVKLNSSSVLKNLLFYSQFGDLEAHIKAYYSENPPKNDSRLKWFLERCKILRQLPEPFGLSRPIWSRKGGLIIPLEDLTDHEIFTFGKQLCTYITGLMDRNISPADYSLFIDMRNSLYPWVKAKAVPREHPDIPEQFGNILSALRSAIADQARELLDMYSYHEPEQTFHDKVIQLTPHIRDLFSFYTKVIGLRPKSPYSVISNDKGNSLYRDHIEKIISSFTQLGEKALEISNRLAGQSPSIGL